MNREQLIEKLNKSWADFYASFAGLEEGQLLKSGVNGEWSVKDILAHVNAWEEEALKYLPLILEGKKTPRYSRLYGGIDAFNAQVINKMTPVAITEIRNKLDKTHAELLNYLNSLPSEQFAYESRFRRRLRLDTYSHYPIHTQAIRMWKEQLNIQSE